MYNHDVAAGRALYYEGRICDSMPFLEKFRRLDSDEQYLCEFNKEYDDLMSNVLDMFPDIRWRLKMNPKNREDRNGCRCAVCL
jgi:predicted proteasome-type protease